MAADSICRMVPSTSSWRRSVRTREVEAAYRAACSRFVTVLDELCGELAFVAAAVFAGD